MSLSAADIQGAHDVTVEKVATPEWGRDGEPDAHVYVRTMPSADRDRYMVQFIDHATGRVRSDARNMTATLLAMTVCDAGGALLFPNQAEAVKAFALRNAVVCERVFLAAARLNGLNTQEVEAIRADFSPTPNGASPSG